MSSEDARVIFSGLIHDGIQPSRLSPKARQEIRDAIDRLIALAGKPTT